MTDFTKIPFDKIVRFGQDTMLDKNLFSISWILGRFCNYNCSYCWPYAHSNEPDYQSLNTYLKTIESIKKQAGNNGYTNFHWSFSGGEPTAYKELLSILYEVSGDSIHMTTNLSPGMKWWDRYLMMTRSSRRRSITASFHHEFANEKEFGDKILCLMENNVFVTVNQVMVPEHFNKLYDRCERLHKRGINITLKPQSDPTASFVLSDYTENQLMIMRCGFPQLNKEEEVLQVKLIDNKDKVWYIDQAERFNSYGFNKFKGWTCNAGFQGIVIRSNEVKRSYSCKDEIIGTLSDGFNIFDNPKVCITNTCVSSADSKIPKWKD